ncbi:MULTISPECIES: hypothetical protein [unclassified Sphingomonas]|uniref:hypothetical protein n=1 Tax=unclassified Sphingomonas TaxID=196159 RepID=UPI0006F2A6DC|nr:MULTISPECIES: hypothetical protein [unclassified Sphingomonas]KQM27295.1 hypothetical protein ASE58_10145 [Sphingomonas sp. Leaf9]KQM43632.1 hypothetical protein ASE57_10150 [Sphingomonas sp. Leaf11]
MTEMLDLIREAAKVLPETQEREAGEATVFTVEGNDFVRIVGDSATVRGDDGWSVIDADSDPVAIEDAVAHAWELAAPRALLEAGGR